MPTTVPAGTDSPANSVKHTVLTHPLPQLVQRLVRKENLTVGDAEQNVQDMLQFLYLCGSSSEPSAPTAAIDVAWHHFILFTRDYREFCLRHFGKFIDHVPNADGADPEIGRAVARRTIERARLEFGALSGNWDLAPEGVGCIEDSCAGDDGQKCSGTTNCQNG